MAMPGRTGYPGPAGLIGSLRVALDGLIHPDVNTVAERPFAGAGLLPRIRPFALVGGFATVAVAVLPPESDPVFLAAGAVAALLTIGSAFAVNRLGLPARYDVCPPLVGVVTAAILRHAAGGHEAGLVTLLALPIVWVALYGTRSQMIVILVAAVLATVVPIVVVGAPAYPESEWRRTIIDSAVGALVITTVSGLVTAVRVRSRMEAARAAELAVREASHRAVLESAQDAIVTLAPDGTILDVNPAAVAMFRGSREELVGRDLISTLATGKEQEFLRQGMARLTVLQDETTSRRFRTELLRLDGEAFPADVTVGVVADGSTYRVHAFARDTSERTRAEAAARQQLDDLQALLAVGRELGTPERASSLRATICSTALSVGSAALTLLFEPEGEDLVLTASAGRRIALERVPRGGTSGVGLVASTGEALFSSRLIGDPRVSQTLTRQTAANAGYWQPIHGPGGVAGVLVVLWDDEIETLDPRVKTLLNILASQAEVALEMTKLVGRLESLARTDGLTGIANRRTFNEALVLELARAARSDRTIGLVMLDLDHFKAYNDARGHQAGDRLLVGAAAAWQAELRPSDLLARYGGEEFAVILPDCAADAAVHVANRLRRRVTDGQTVSAGVAISRPDDTPETLVGRADGALYAAKAAGRDRVEAG